MPKPSKRDKYLRKRYGISEAEHDAMFVAQGGKCKICGKEPTGRPLHVDHDHSLRYYKLISRKTNDGWTTTTNNSVNKVSFNLEVYGKTKSESVKTARLYLLRYSIRGLICYHCNTTLKWARDNPLILKSASRYLQNYYLYLTHGAENARQTSPDN